MGYHERMNLHATRVNAHAIQVIDALGGTAAVARIFDLSMPSVSDWKKDGVPSARMMFLRVTKRKELAGIDLDAATAPKTRSIAEAKAA